MSREIKKFFFDIEEAISIIESYPANIDNSADYKNDLKTIDAVERRLAIIGEALWKADKIDPTLNVSSKKQIIALRHILVHDYDLVDDNTIWIICKRNLPILKAETERILKS